MVEKTKPKAEKERANIYIAGDVATILGEIRPRNRSEFFNDAVRLIYRWQDQILEQVNIAIDAKLDNLIECRKKQNAQMILDLIDIQILENIAANPGKPLMRAIDQIDGKTRRTLYNRCYILSNEGYIKIVRGSFALATITAKGTAAISMRRERERPEVPA